MINIMTYTRKQQSVLSLINKLNKTVFSPEELYQAQGNNQLLSRKAITVHLGSLIRDHAETLTRVKKGQYMLTETITAAAPQQTITIMPKEDLPGFLAHEDIDKLIEWKNSSIRTTNESIDNLKLKITKLENQKEQLNSIKSKFC
jgi:hypothetical protein